VDRLLAEGHVVVGVDNLCTGRRENLADAMKSPRFTFVEADITTDFTLPTLAYTYVWHLASPASPKDYRRLSIETMMVNAVGTKKMLDLALAHGARFLLASTSEVYGNPEVHPQPEDYWGNVNPVGERACYDEGKRFAEALTMEYWRRYRVDVRIVRVFNCYGPRMQADDGRVVPNFVNQALRGEPLTVYGDGSQTRSFCYVDDLVDGLVRVMFAPGLAGEVFNLGSPEEHTVLQLAETIAGLCGVSLRVVRLPLPSDDPRRRCPDVTKARSLLGWHARTRVEDGLTKTVSYFRELIKGCLCR
jgi:nucleoside-diphosphate-sugar epimerase